MYPCAAKAQSRQRPGLGKGRRGSAGLPFSTGAYADGEESDALKVILLDLRLPKVDGLEVLRRIRADERTMKIPVVVLTSSQEDPDVAESYSIGANSFISKPVNFSNFSDTVEKLGLYWLLINRTCPTQ